MYAKPSSQAKSSKADRNVRAYLKYICFLADFPGNFANLSGNFADLSGKISFTDWNSENFADYKQQSKTV